MVIESEGGVCGEEDIPGCLLARILATFSIICLIDCLLMDHVQNACFLSLFLLHPFGAAIIHSNFIKLNQSMAKKKS